jgi:CubicO group peptidase (beta-lactamase class C family)
LAGFDKRMCQTSHCDRFHALAPTLAPAALAVELAFSLAQVTRVNQGLAGLSLPTAALTPAAVTSTAVPTTVLVTLTAVEATLAAASTTDTTAQPLSEQAIRKANKTRDMALLSVNEGAMVAPVCMARVSACQWRFQVRWQRCVNHLDPKAKTMSMPMTRLTVNNPGHDFSPVHAVLARHVEQNLLAGAASAVLKGQDLLDLHCTGWADKENDIALRSDHIFRSYSDSKLITSMAVLLLWQEGRFQLDDPIDGFIPQLAKRQVLKPGATTLDDTEPAAGPITIRHLLSHSSGLSYGLLDHGTMIFKAYRAKAVLNPFNTLEQMMDALADLPLLFHPGTGWEYSVATDVLGRLVEVVSGQRFDEFLQTRIFAPLGMVDTGFVVPPEKQSRFTAFYVGADLAKPLVPGLTRNDNAPYPGAYVNAVPWLSGGGGLVSTLPDMIALIRSLLPGGPALLKPETIALMMSNQLPEGLNIKFPRFGEITGKVFGLGGAITQEPNMFDPPASKGEFQWGGLAGTHWWINPHANVACLVMTQRHLAFWHPYFFEHKHAVYQALASKAA